MLRNIKLICDTLKHAAVGRVGDWEDVWRHIMASFAFVEFNDFLRVDWQSLVWVDHHTEQSWIGSEIQRNSMSFHDHAL